MVCNRAEVKDRSNYFTEPRHLRTICSYGMRTLRDAELSAFLMYDSVRC
jgi:hypothetical protein